MGERRRGDFFWIWPAREPTGIFSARTLRGRPLADSSRARVVRKAPSSENLPVIPAQQPRPNPKEIPCWRVLRTAGTGGMDFTRRRNGGSMARNQNAIFEKFAGYFRGRARPNPKETLCIRVLAVGYELVGCGLGFLDLLWAGASVWLFGTPITFCTPVLLYSYTSFAFPLTSDFGPRTSGINRFFLCKGGGGGV